MQLHHKLRILREYLNLTHAQMGALMNVTGGCYGRWERGETRPDHERIQQLASVFKVSAQILTNNEPLWLRIYETEKGEIAFEIQDENTKQQQYITQLEEEVTRLRKTIADMEYHKNLQNEIITRQNEELKKRKKR